MLDPDSPTSIAVLLSLLTLHAYFVAAIESISNIRQARRLQLVKQGKLPAKLVEDFVDYPTLLPSTGQLALKLIGFLLVTFAVASYTVPLALAILTNNLVAAIIIAVISAIVVFLLGDLFPREVARRWAEPVAIWTIYPVFGVSYLVKPWVMLAANLHLFSSAQLSQAQANSSSIITEEELLSYVDVGEEEGVLQQGEREMIYSIMDLDNTLAREVMVPRIDIVAVEANISLERAVDVVINAGHSRVPVYLDSIDNVIGILYVKDLLVYWHSDSPPATIRKLEREVYFVPETKPVSELLRELQVRKVHIAIVVDEYGGTAGLVTIEDILEEIVGEIQDEHDADEFYMQYISDDEYIFSARMDLDDINNVMSINLPTADSDTLGGLIYNILGRIPAAGDSFSGESFDAPDLYFTVLEVEGRRIKRVKITHVRKELNPDQRTLKPAVNPETSSALINNPRKTLSESS